MLTRREIEVIHLASLGKTSEDSAQLLGVSKRTIDFHRENACRKLDSFSIIKACCDAVRLGLIPTAAAFTLALILSIMLDGEEDIIRQRSEVLPVYHDQISRHYDEYCPEEIMHFSKRLNDCEDEYDEKERDIHKAAKQENRPHHNP